MGNQAKTRPEPNMRAKVLIIKKRLIHPFDFIYVRGDLDLVRK